MAGTCGKQIADIQAKGAIPIVLTLTIRDKWINGKIERDPAQTPIPEGASTTADNRQKEPTRYSIWSAEIAKAGHLPLLDVHNMIADRYEKEGKFCRRTPICLVLQAIPPPSQRWQGAQAR